MEYKNLELQLSDYKREHDGEHYQVRVLNSPDGIQRDDQSDRVTLPAELRRRMRRLEQRSVALPEMIELGTELGNRLFPPGARRFLDNSRAMLQGKGDTCLCIQLRLETYALADLPWEYAYIPKGDTPIGREGPEGFLALDPSISLVRYEVMPGASGTMAPVDGGELRMLLLLADPQVAEWGHLDLDRDLDNLKEALASVPRVHLDAVQGTTRQKLVDAVQRDPHPDIFHFAGHGEFTKELGVFYGSTIGAGNLVLLGEGGGEDLFDAGTLAVLLNKRNVRLAVLGACEGGRRDGVNAWTGVAPALTRAGIPAVVGNQYTIKDKNAIAFTRSFYRTLAEGGSIDLAVTNGRQQVFALSGAGDRDWGVPVLYLRSETGVIFPRPERGQSVVVNRPEVGDSDIDVNKTKLRRVLVEKFERPDLEELCADIQQALEDDGIYLKVSLDMVGGRTQSYQALNLIRYLENRDHLGYLVRAVRRARPGSI